MPLSSSASAAGGESSSISAPPPCVAWLEAWVLGGAPRRAASLASSLARLALILAVSTSKGPRAARASARHASPSPEHERATRPRRRRRRHGSVGRWGGMLAVASQRVGRRGHAEEGRTLVQLLLVLGESPPAPGGSRAVGGVSSGCSRSIASSTHLLISGRGAADEHASGWRVATPPRAHTTMRELAAAHADPATQRPRSRASLPPCATRRRGRVDAARASRRAAEHHLVS